MPPGDILLIAKRGLYRERCKPLLSVWDAICISKSRYIYPQENEGKAGQDPGQKDDRKQEQPLVVFISIIRYSAALRKAE